MDQNNYPNGYFIQQHTQPPKKRRVDISEEKHDLTNDPSSDDNASLSPKPWNSTSQETPIDFSLKSTKTLNGTIKNDNHSLPPSVIGNQFALDSIIAAERKKTFNHVEYLSEENGLNNSPPFVQNPIPTFPDNNRISSKMVCPIRDIKTEGNSSRESIFPINNTSFNAIQPSNLFMDEGFSFRGEINSGSNGNARLPFIPNGFNPLPYANYSPPVADFQRFYSNSMPVGISSSHQLSRGGPLDISPDPRPSKTIRPFKEYESEILTYQSSFPTPTYVPSIYPNISRPNTVPVTSTPVASPPIQHEPNRSPESNESMEMENNSENDFPNDAQPLPDSNTSTARRRGQKVPEEEKGPAYKEKRRKNNEAAKRSRDARRLKEDQMATKAKEVIEYNKLLRFQLQHEIREKIRLQIELNNMTDKYRTECFRADRSESEKPQCRCREESDVDPRNSALVTI